MGLVVIVIGLGGDCHRGNMGIHVRSVVVLAYIL